MLQKVRLIFRRASFYPVFDTFQFIGREGCKMLAALHLDQFATCAIAWEDDRAILTAFHRAGIGGKIQAFLRR